MAVSDDWPLVGRDAELGIIDELLADVGSGFAASGMVFAGDTGVGRTRLLREALRRASLRGCRTELVSATRAAASIPFGPLAHLLPADPQAGIQVFQFMTRRWSTDTNSRPLVLGIDDAQLLDDASAALLHRLATQGSCSVVMTIEPSQPTVDAVVALWKDDALRRIDLRPLDDIAMSALLEQALPGQVAGSASARLLRLANGNPLILRELLRDGAQSGALRETDGVWRWSGDVTNSWRLTALVDARLRLVGRGGRSAAELVACGEPLPLAAFADLPYLGRAERAGLIDVVEEDGRAMVRLAQPVHGEVLRASLGPIRRRAIHRALLARCAKTPLHGRDELLRLASWRLSAGLSEQDGVLVVAARRAIVLGELELAQRLAREAAQHGHAVAISLLAEMSRFRDAVGNRAMAALFESDLEVAIAGGGVSVEGRLWGCVAAVIALALVGRTADALALAEGGVRLAEQRADRVLFAGPYVRVAQVIALRLAGKFAVAEGLAEDGYRVATNRGDEALAALWAAQRGLLAQDRGDIELALRYLREAVTVADPHGLRPGYRAILAGAHALSGDARSGQRQLEECGDRVPPILAPLIEINRGRVALAAGDRRRAIDFALRGAELAIASGQRATGAIALYDVARHGDPVAVAGRLAELANETDSDFVHACAAAAVALAEGDGAALERAGAAFDALGARLFAAEITVERQENPLTPREQEIAALAGQGLTSREIALRLRLSVRTVDNHLGRVFTKLGISGRTELAS